MSNDVEIVVTGKDRTGPMFASVKNSVNDLGKSFETMRTRVKTSFNQMHGDIRTSLLQNIGEAETRGKQFGDALVHSMGSSLRGTRNVVRNAAQDATRAFANEIKDSGSQIKEAATGAVSGGFKGALSTPILGPVIITAVLAAATAVAPLVATVVGGAIILGMGTGLAALGTAALFHTEDIDKKWSKSEQARVKESNKQAELLKKQWGNTFREVIGGLKEAAQPLIPVLDTARSVIKDVGKEFKPVIESALALSAGPLKSFTKDLGEGFKQFAPAIGPVMEAFNQLIGVIGPMLPGIFKDVADALIDLSGVVIENKDLFGTLFYILAESVPVAISALSNLIQFFETLRGFVARTGAAMVDSMVDMADGVLGAVEAVLSAIALIPGPMQDAMRSAAESVHNARQAMQEWKATADAMPKIIELEAKIDKLESNLETAKRGLKDPNLTKTRKAELKAEISSLQSAIWRAKQALASVQGKTVTIFVKTEVQSDLSRAALRGANRAHGGIVGGGLSAFAQGGISGVGGSTALVGEQGPELVSLPYGSTVTGSGQTRAMMAAQQGSGATNRASTSLTAASLNPIVEIIKAVAKALKEVLSLRDAMGKLTTNIFGQERAITAYEAAWDAAQKSLKEHKKTLATTTEAGRANRAALVSLAEAAHEVLFNMDEMNKPVSSMVAKMKEQRAEFIRMARAMGMTAAAAAKLADKYGLIPSKVKTAVTTERSNVAANKKIEAANKKAGLTAAGGGPRSGYTLVGEAGPELVRLPSGSNVLPAGRTADMLSSEGGGVSVLHITLQLGNNTIGELLIDPLRKSIRTRGGNVQAVLGKG